MAPVEDAEALTLAIARLIRNRGLRTRLCRAAEVGIPENVLDDSFVVWATAMWLGSGSRWSPGRPQGYDIPLVAHNKAAPHTRQRRVASRR